MRNLVPLLTLLVIAQHVLIGSYAAKWSPQDFPDPKRDVNLCGRGKPSSVCDADGILSKPSGDRIDGIIAEIYEGQDPYVRAQCGDKGLEGYRIGVALLKRMDLDGQAPADAARNFAKLLHNKWGVGDAACDNGILIFLALDDRQVYISTGKGAANTLDDEQLSIIIDSMKPALRAGNYDTAVELAVVDVGLGLAGRKKEKDHHWDIFPILFFGGLAFFLGKTAWNGMKRRREFKDCKKMLDKLKQEQQRLSTREWSKPCSCPVCLEDFTVDPEAGGGGDCSGGGNGEGSSSDPPTAPLLSSLDGSGSSKAEGSGSGGGSGPSLAAVKAGMEGSSGTPGVVRLPMTLECGHTFCEPCLQEWLDHATTCPICRKPINSDLPGQTPPPPSSGQQQAGGVGGGRVRGIQRAAWDDIVAMDLAFRLSALQRRYPEFVTPGMANAWSAEARQTGSFDWEGCRSFQVRDPGMRAQHEARGAGGFGGSFGGGHGGGGGSGGSW